MKTITLTTLGFAALLVVGAVANGCSSANNTTGSGGSSGTTGAGGSGTGSGGSTANGGSTGAGGSQSDASTTNLPLCDSSVKDKGTCAAGSADCNKTCGISGSNALKPCTCTTAGTWNCSGGTCVYPAGFDASCYPLPSAPAACPANTQSNVTMCTTTTPCSMSVCSGYVDSTGAAKTGYCACSGMKAFDGGAPVPVYLCASTTEWPSH
jgi:hypothetical protein